MNDFVEKYRMAVHKKDERLKLVTEASKALDINDEKKTEDLLIKNSKELDDKYIKEFAQQCIRDPDSFVEKHKLKERIAKEILPCIVHMDGLGRIMSSNSMDNGCDLKCITFNFKMSKDYKAEGWRC